MTKRYHYTNGLGYRKTLVVYDEKDGRCSYEIWSAANGELCTTGTATKQEIKEFLSIYGVAVEE